MKVDIWSDVRCPFCYIGKRKLEAGLENFGHKDEIEIVWHSFELDPSLKTNPNKNIFDYLAEMKGQTREWSVQMHEHVSKSARQEGLTFNFDKSVIANSFNAHRLIQLAKSRSLGNEVEEALFSAHFTEGKNIDDNDTLVALGETIGLEKTVVEQMLASNAFAKEVREDVATAQSIGIRSVPFFIFNERYAISGAQPVETFVQTLEKAWNEQQLNPAASTKDNSINN